MLFIYSFNSSMFFLIESVSLISWIKTFRIICNFDSLFSVSCDLTLLIRAILASGVAFIKLRAFWAFLGSFTAKLAFCDPGEANEFFNKLRFFLETIFIIFWWSSLPIVRVSFFPKEFLSKLAPCNKPGFCTKESPTKLAFNKFNALALITLSFAMSKLTDKISCTMSNKYVFIFSKERLSKINFRYPWIIIWLLK